MGDGLMALFGVDHPQEAALRAVRAGLGMLEAVEQLKAYLENIYSMSFQIGIGGITVTSSSEASGAKDQREDDRNRGCGHPCQPH